MIAAAIYVGAAWRMAPVHPAGDEPHYLIITQSLLYDGDLRIENNHRRGDYRAYTPQEIPPDYLKRGIDGQIYSIHAPGLPALILPAFALAGYRGVIVFLAVLSALGSVLVWHAASRLTASPGAAWFGWAAVTLTAPFLFQAFTVFPDGAGAVAVMTGVYALVFPESLARSRARALAHGAVLAALPWLHTRYAVLAAMLGALVTLRLWQQSRTATVGSPRSRALGDCLVFLLVPIVSAVAWFGFFHAIYGSLDPRAPYGTNTQTSLASAPRGLAGLLVDQQFGLLPNAPVYLVGFAGFGALWHIRRRLALELVLVALPYAIVVASYHMWWGGHSSPARFVVPVLLPFGLAAAAGWSRGTPVSRAVCAVLLASSLGLSAALVWANRGALVYNLRDGYSLWMDRAAPLVSMPRAVPTLFRNSPVVTAGLVAGWALVALVAWALTRALLRGRTSAHRATITWLAAMATMTAGIAFGWHIAGAAPLESGTGLNGIMRAAAARGGVLNLPSLVREPAADALAQLRVPSALRRDRPADGLLFAAWDLPAGQYRVMADERAPLTGTLEATVGRRVAPLWRVTLDGSAPGATAMLLDLTVGARVLTIQGDERAHRSLEAVSLHVERFTPGPVPEYAAQAVRYGDVLVWFVDEGAFAEPEGWWVQGNATAAFVLETTSDAASQRLLVRNGGARNRIVLASGAWQARLDLNPGDDRRIDVPLVNSHARLVVTSESGFRPSEVDPASRDERLLGVWLQPLTVDH
jgi:hypothetical protein